MEKNKKGEYLIIVLFVAFTLTILVTTYFSNYYIKEYTNIIQDTIRQRLLIEGKSASKLISTDLLQEFREPEDMEKPIYQEMVQKIRNYAEENGLMYVYFMRLHPDGRQQIILDSDPDPETHLGLDYFEDPDELTFGAFMGESTCSIIGEYTEGWEGVFASYTPIYDSDGNIIAIVGVDISDEEIVEIRNRAEMLGLLFVTEAIIIVVISFIVVALYSKKAQEYNNASIAKSQFLSRMSHEIRTPMNAIIGFSRMAKNVEDNSKKNEYLENIDSSSEYLLQLINSILDISKIEAGRMVLDIEKASPNKIMQDIHEMLSSQAKSKKQKFTINIAENIPKYVYCDKTHLTQVIVNLLSNALKFTPEDGEVSVTVNLLEKKDDLCNLQFIIKDNGIGIDEQYLEKIFEPFEQGESGITRRYGGTGLGLAISKLLVEMMQGQISVISKTGEGTTFIFNVWLNIVPEGEEPKEKKEEIKTTIDCAGKVFLVVEDNEINQIIAENVLKNLGASIEFADNGKEGLEKFIANPKKYDIIFMDIQMPIMDGFEATKQIRKSNVENAQTIPIIAMTAEVFREDVDHAFEVGMNAHIGKPFKIEEIVLAITKALTKD